MSESSVIAPDPNTVIDTAFADLAANADPGPIIATLREIEPWIQGNTLLKAKLLRARAVGLNRLGEGFSGDALGDLFEARNLLEAANEPGELAKIFLAIATVCIWRGDSREASFALLRAVAEADTAGDPASGALALAEAGRLQIENGRPTDAQAILSRALTLGGDALPKREYQRAWNSLLQATVAANLLDKALALRNDAGGVLSGASQRLKLLERLESVRIERLREDHAAARAALAEAKALAPADPKAFEQVEIAQVEAELALDEDDAAEAARLLHDIVIARYAADALAAREVQARLLHAQALEKLELWEEVDRTLAAALRVALARGLNGFADQVRHRIAARGGDERAGLTGDVPADAALPDFDARFVRQRLVGGGGFAKVTRAYDLELGVEVAIKRSSLKDVFDPARRGVLLEAARTEVQAASRLNHPGIARVYGLLAEANGDMVLVQEFVEGPDLRAAMASGLDAPRVFDILARVAYSLTAVHATGVVHRDLKPDNIILRGGTTPVLVDFGIALLSKAEGGAIGGTPGYMPPEQENGADVDARADLYALGVTAYELLLGRMPIPSRSRMPAPFRGYLRRRSIRNELVEAGIDAEIADLITGMMAERPRARPESAAIVGASFAEAGARASGRTQPV